MMNIFWHSAYIRSVNQDMGLPCLDEQGLVMPDNHKPTRSEVQHAMELWNEKKDAWVERVGYVLNMALQERWMKIGSDGRQAMEELIHQWGWDRVPPDDAQRAQRALNERLGVEVDVILDALAHQSVAAPAWWPWKKR